MKSQDILLLLKLVSLSDQDRPAAYSISAQPNTQPNAQPSIEEVDSPRGEHARKSTVLHVNEPRHMLQATFLPTTADQYTVRSLALVTGISKSQVSLSLARCYESRLARPDRQNNAAQVPEVNRRALCEFLVHGVKYVFPVRLGGRTRGIPTAWAAPVLQGKLLAGDTAPPVWPDAGDPDNAVMGFALEPIYKSVPYAVKHGSQKDERLYALLALVDSIRIGGARERAIATDLLAKMLGGVGV